MVTRIIQGWNQELQELTDKRQSSVSAWHYPSFPCVPAAMPIPGSRCPVLTFQSVVSKMEFLIQYRWRARDGGGQLKVNYNSTHVWKYFNGIIILYIN